jgi:membrane fusion protein, multidrug efflux system
MAGERKSGLKLVLAFFLLVFLAAGAWISRSYGLWGHIGQGTRSETAQQTKPQTPIPVTFATVGLSDFPIYLDGLGTVQPYDTVTVRSRVDGEVVKVAFKQGQMVKEGDVLVQIDPRPYQAALAQAQAKKAQDEATLRNAKLDLQRATTLARQQAGPTQTVDQQQAQVDQLTAQIQGDQANIENAQTQLSYTTIKSPLTGKVGFRQIDPGNIVHASDANGIVTIVKLQPISVVFTAPEEQVQNINKAMDAGQVPVWALSSDGTKTLAEGHLAIVNNQVDLASGTIQMKATFQNKDNALWPGLSVLTRLRLEMLHNVVVVPNAAVQRGPNGLFAYVIDAQNKAAVRPLQIAHEGDAASQVASGLKPGDRIVVSGQYRLVPGALVEPKEADQATPTQGSPSVAANTDSGPSNNSNVTGER